MTLTLLIEVIVLLVVGGVSIAEGIRLMFGGKLQLYDVLGPGLYNSGMGVILIIVGIIYFFIQRKKAQEGEGEKTPKEYKIKMVAMIAAIALYIVLMNLFGYLFSSLFFFILINRVAGFRSWRTGIPIGIGMTISFYLVFVIWLNMIFPRGTLIHLG
jgi:small-conductance mechanosensitive channel